MKQFYILIAILFFNSIKLEAQTFINGSFENTTSSGCDYNNSNSEFNSKMENVYAFGTAQEVDIKRINCFIPSIPDGDVALAINVQPDGDFDAIALELTSPLISGNRYTISFKAHGNRTFSPNDANLRIGCSTTNDGSNTAVIYIANVVAYVWTDFSFDFDAPNNGTFITVTAQSPDSWSDIDYFNISPTTLSIDDNQIRSSIKIYPNPVHDFLIISGLSSNVNYGIINEFGQNVLKGSISENEKIDINNLASGIYLLIIEEETAFKFIKE